MFVFVCYLRMLLASLHTTTASSSSSFSIIMKIKSFVTLLLFLAAFSIASRKIQKGKVQRIFYFVWVCVLNLFVGENKTNQTNRLWRGVLLGKARQTGHRCVGRGKMSGVLTLGGNKENSWKNSKKNVKIHETTFKWGVGKVSLKLWRGKSVIQSLLLFTSTRESIQGVYYWKVSYFVIVFTFLMLYFFVC